MNRTSFLIDGFNLYHSLVDASIDLKGASTKWLNIASLCNLYVRSLGKDARIEQIYYFSALATHLIHRDPGKVIRHKAFIECLRATGVICQLGRFKAKTVHCNGCRKDITHHEEKETDVAISIKLFEILMHDECDTAIIVSGDTDLVPAIRTVKKLFSGKQICIMFPYKRTTKELATIVDHTFTIKKERYLEHQFNDPVILPNGRTIQKPASW